MKRCYNLLQFDLLRNLFSFFLYFFLFGFTFCKAETARYSVNVNGVNYQRGDRVSVFQGDDIFVELRIHYPSDPDPDRTGGAVYVYQWDVPNCFRFVRQFTPGYNNANQYVLTGDLSQCYGSTLSIAHASFPNDHPAERTPVTVTIEIAYRGFNPPYQPPGSARVGVNDQDSKVSVFPNPTHDLINIDLIGLDNSLNNILGIMLYDDKQNLIKNIPITEGVNKEKYFWSNSFRIDVKDMKKGIYFLHIDVGDRIVKKQILIE